MKKSRCGRRWGFNLSDEALAHPILELRRSWRRNRRRRQEDQKNRDAASESGRWRRKKRRRRVRLRGGFGRVAVREGAFARRWAIGFAFAHGCLLTCRWGRDGRFALRRRLWAGLRGQVAEQARDRAFRRRPGRRRLVSHASNSTFTCCSAEFPECAERPDRAAEWFRRACTAGAASRGNTSSICCGEI